jgi:hypothetical protein
MNDAKAANDGVKRVISVRQVLRIALTAFCSRHIAAGGGNHRFREIQSADLCSSLGSRACQDAMSRTDV